jgi:hypothetical protein
MSNDDEDDEHEILPINSLIPLFQISLTSLLIIGSKLSFGGDWKSGPGAG